MSYDDDEKSATASRPVEIYTFDLPTVTYRLTSYHRDYAFGGLTYTAIPISRSGQTQVPLGQAREISITLPITHALAQALVNNGIPPRDCVVTLSSVQQRSGAARQLWKGSATDLEVDDVELKLRVPNETDNAFAVKLPVATAQRLCNHMLYDTACTQSRTDGANFITGTVSAISGSTITVSMAGKPDQWARYGDVTRAVDGERRSIVDQTGNLLTLDVPFGALTVGETVTVNKGCDHTLLGANGCTTFGDPATNGNAANFGGHPDMPEHNPMAPTGYGTVTQA